MSYSLKIDIQSYWHPGTGKGEGANVDATTMKNSDGLPILPGRTLKGILRDAVARWESFKNENKPGEPGLAEQLFGPEADADEKWPGLLRVNDAELGPDETFFLLKDKETLLPGLYRHIHSTSIEHKTGTARDKSLRGMEVIVPLTLYATLEEIPTAKYVELEDWIQRIKPALGLIKAVGAHRTRGLGRATVSLEGEK